MSSRKKIMITLIIILLLLTAGVYGYGVYYFTEHFLPGSMVNGFNCSYMTVSQSEELLTQKVGAYVLTIDTRITDRKVSQQNRRDFPMTQMEVLIN